MAINDAISAYAAQAGAADQAYKDAWANTPTGGAGQFGGAGVLENASRGLSAMAAQNPASTVMQTKPLNVTSNAGLRANMIAASNAGLRANMIAASNTAKPIAGNLDALPTTPTASASTDPIKAAIETTSNFSRENPYVADVTDAGDVGRQAARPDRLLIDDTMSADEQYRRAWQNESNGFYGNTPDVTEKPVAPDPVAPPEPKPEGALYQVHRTTMGDGIGGRTQIIDKATNKIIHTFVDDGSGGPEGLMEGLVGGNGGNISASRLKELTGWEYDPNKWNPYTEQNVFRNYKPPVAATPSAAAPSGTNTGEFS